MNKMDRVDSVPVFYGDYLINRTASERNGEEYIGKYGEYLFFTKIGDDKWIFSSSELNMYDFIFDNQGKKYVVNHYVQKGYPNFDLNNYLMVWWRLDHLHDALVSFYQDYCEKNNELSLSLLKELLLNVELFNLKRDRYLNQFVIGCDMENKSDFKTFVFKLRKAVLIEQKNRIRKIINGEIYFFDVEDIQRQCGLDYKRAYKVWKKYYEKKKHIKKRHL